MRKHGVPSANVPRRPIYRFRADGKLSISGVPRRSCTCRTRRDDVHLPRSWTLPIVVGQSLYRGSDPRVQTCIRALTSLCAQGCACHCALQRPYTHTHARAQRARARESIGGPRTCVKSGRFCFSRTRARHARKREEVRSDERRHRRVRPRGYASPGAGAAAITSLASFCL